MRNQTLRILAQDQYISNDTWKTGLNNNDIIIGPSGCGKTRSYVKPNILQCNESMIITDTKGSLYSEIGPVLKKHGFHVIRIDFTDLLQSSCGYNPLDHIRRNPRTDAFLAQDILTAASVLIPIESTRDPFWDSAAQMYMACLIGYVLECLPKREHTLEYVARLFMEMSSNSFDKLLTELGECDPKSFAYTQYRLFSENHKAEKMHASIRGMIGNKISPLTYDGPLHLYQCPKRIDFKKLGKEKTALFLTVSDMDRSMDRLINLFYTQALHVLCQSADQDYPDHRLPIPVRFILDDFAAGTYIPDFDKIISVIRSREISTSIILQSISQLESLYGHSKAMTILNNCDNCLYLGGSDTETANYIGVKTNKTAQTILNMPLSDAWLFTRGSAPKKVRKYDIRQHDRYRELPEAPGNAPDSNWEVIRYGA